MIADTQTARLIVAVLTRGPAGRCGAFRSGVSDMLQTVAAQAPPARVAREKERRA